MTDVSVADTAREVAANFTSGFDDVPVKKPDAVVADGEKDKGKGEAVTKDAAPAVAADAPAAPIPVPKRARITHEEWEKTRTFLNDAKAAMGKMASFESQIARLNGALGAVQQAVAQKQAETPLGLNVTFDDDDFKEWTENYPELSGISRRTLENLFKKVKVGPVTGTADPAKTEQTPPAQPAAAPTALTREDVAKVLQEEKAKEAADKFVAAYPKWRDIVGAPDVDDGPRKPSGDAFHAWLGTQPAEYQTRVTTTDDPSVLHAALDLFTVSQKTAPAAPANGQNRRAVIEGAVTPAADGAGPLPPRAKTEAEAMREGFTTG